MKKILSILLSLGLVCSSAFADISVEPLLNQCLSSSGDALKVSLTGGNAVMTALSADTITAYNVLSADNAFNWEGGNTYYLQVGDDINAFIASASCATGDTIILGSGTYTITDNISIAKSVNIVGQGVGETIIACATASKQVFNPLANSLTIRIANMTINNTGGTGVAIYGVATSTTGYVFENLDINVSGAGSNQGIFLSNNTATIRNVTFNVTSTNNIAQGFYLRSSSVGAGVYTLINCKGTADGGGSTGSASFYAYNNNHANICTANLYNCQGTALTGGTEDGGLVASSATTSNVVVSAYNCTFSGSDYDAINSTATTAAGQLTLYNTTLVNNTTSGTITYGGTVVSKNLSGDRVKIGTAIMTADSTAPAGVVGRIRVVTQDGAAPCFIPIYAN